MHKIFIVLLFLVSVFTVFSEEKKKELPVKPIFDFTAQYHYDTKGDSLAGMNWSEADQYVRNELKGGLVISAFKNDYLNFTVTPSIKDRFDIRIKHTPLTATPRNRLYGNVDLNFNIAKLITVNFGNEIRFESDFAKSSLSLRFAPADVTLMGNFDFGFSFFLKQLVGLHLSVNENVYNKGQSLALTELEGLYRIAFNIFKLIKPIDDYKVKGTIYARNFLILLLFPDYSTSQSLVRYHDLTVGFETEFANVKIRAAYYFSTQYSKFDERTIKDTKIPLVNIYQGFETGASFSKDWFEVGITYIGRMLGYQKNGDTITVDYATISKRTTAQLGSSWESHIDTYVKFKL